MKRTVLILFLLASVSAYAGDKPAPMPLGGQMMPPAGCGMMKGGGMPMGGEPVSLTKKQAQSKFSEFLSKNMKGFEIKDVNSVHMPFGAIHQAEIADKNGNRFYLNITPEGDVVGPVLAGRVN